MVNDRKVAILYTSAVCNLNCVYCSIDKNPALKVIDKILEDSFNGSYYFDYMREIFPDPKQLTRIETWGGEPSLGWHRIHHVLRDVIGYYPNFSEFFSSTNMVQPNFQSELADLLSVFAEYPDRKFKFVLQLSLDGPTAINDFNRGIGTTAKFTDAFRIMCGKLADIVPKNVVLETYFKATLDADCIRQLQTEQAIIDYYSFFEGYYGVFDELNHSPNAHIFPTVPNTATPAQHTIEDGHLFANMCKLCRDLEHKGGVFKYFKEIMPYNANPSLPLEQISCSGFTCGTCKSVIGLLPNHMISGCHAAFVDLIDDYKKHITADSYRGKVLDEGMFTRDPMNFFCFEKERLGLRERQMECYYAPNTTARLVGTKALIQSLAFAGQIESRFTDDALALQAADVLYRNASNCMKDNLGANATVTLPSVSLIKLLLNGAYDYITTKEGQA